MHDHRLGALLLENPLMREEDLDRCLEIQQLTGGARPLGQILVDEGVISADDLEQLLEVQSERRAAGTSEAATAASRIWRTSSKRRSRPASRKSSSVKDAGSWFGWAVSCSR